MTRTLRALGALLIGLGLGAPLAQAAFLLVSGARATLPATVTPASYSTGATGECFSVDVVSCATSSFTATAGGVNVVVIRISNMGDILTGVTDSLGNIYSNLCVGVDMSVTSTTRTYAYAAENVAAGSTVITATISSAQTFRIVAAHYINASTNGDAIEDVACGKNDSNASTQTTGSVTTGGANRLIVSGVGVDGTGATSIAPGSGETERHEASARAQIQDEAAATSGSYSASWSFGAAEGAAYFAAAIKGVSGGGGGGPTGSELKWEPGFAFSFNAVVGSTTSQGTIDGLLAQIDEMCNVNQWVGVQLWIFWGGYEGPTAGDYSRGHALVQQFMDHVEPCGMWLAISVFDVMFGGYPPSDLRHWFPDYILQPARGGTDTGGIYGVTTNEVNGDGQIAHTWQAATMDRIIARNNDICAQWGDEPAFYMNTGSETSVNMSSGAGYSTAALITQLKRSLTAARTACPTTHVRLAANFVGSDAQMIDLLDYCEDLDCAIGGPDTFTAAVYPQQSNEVFAGTIGGHDRRAEQFFAAEVQSTSICGYKQTTTPSQIYGVWRNGDTGISPLFPTLMIVTREETVGGPYSCTTANNWTAWRNYVESTLSPAGAVMDGSSSTLRTQSYVKTNVCPSQLDCDN